MKRLLGPIVIVVGVVVAGKLGTDAFRARTLELERQKDAARLKQSYLERVGWLRSNPDEQGYRGEVGTFFRGYFKDVDAHVEKFGLDPQFGAYVDELARREKEGKDPKGAEKRARWEAVKAQLAAFRKDYAPRWTASDKGMRLDILAATRKLKDGKPVLEMPFVLWGAQRELREDGRGTRKMFTSATFGYEWKLWDAKGKLLGELNGEGAENLVDWPELYVELFPPQMVFGTFPLAPVPAEVATLEMAFTVKSLSNSGGEAAARYSWKMDAPAEWKLQPGETWEGATETVRPEDEIDPSRKKKG